jgi:ABC-2 type transport system ATP-binding protein
MSPPDGLIGTTSPPSLPRGVALQTLSLGKRYGDRWAVRGLDLLVPSGSVFGLLGPNGAGKSTTLRMLTGLLKPTEGTATVAGLDLNSQRHLLGQRIGVVFEQQNLYDRLTPLQNLVFFADLLGVGHLRAEQLLDEAGLGDRKGEALANLSKGLRQRVLIARALLAQPQVLFLDEPTSGLDPASAHQLRSWIRSCAERGTTVVLTTHDLEDAQALCQQVAILHQGQLHALDSPASLIARHAPPCLRIRWQAHGHATVEVREVALQADDIAQVLAELSQRGTILELCEARPTLENVFLQLTGAALD